MEIASGGLLVCAGEKTLVKCVVIVRFVVWLGWVFCKIEKSLSGLNKFI